MYLCVSLCMRVSISFCIIFAFVMCDAVAAAAGICVRGSRCIICMTRLLRELFRERARVCGARGQGELEKSVIQQIKYKSQRSPVVRIFYAFFWFCLLLVLILPDGKNVQSLCQGFLCAQPREHTSVFLNWFLFWRNSKIAFKYFNFMFDFCYCCCVIANELWIFSYRPSAAFGMH